MGDFMRQRQPPFARIEPVREVVGQEDAPAHDARGRRPGDTGNTFWLPAYNSYDAFVNYTWNKYTFNLRVDNLEDEYYLHSAINRNIINAGPPRGATLRVSREF